MTKRTLLDTYRLIISGSYVNLIILLSNKSNNDNISFPKIIRADCEWSVHIWIVKKSSSPVVPNLNRTCDYSTDNTFSCLDHTFPVHLFYQRYMQETGDLNITSLVQ